MPGGGRGNDMKKFLRAMAIGLSAALLLSVPAAAASVVTSDAFSKSSQKPWESDQKDPAKWDTGENYLSITVGRQGTVLSRTQNGGIAARGGVYDVQGKKLALDKPSSDSWTASVKLNVDQSWYSTSVSRRTAVFRLDLVDGGGNPLETPAALALEKRSGSTPQWACLNPELLDGWSYPKMYSGTSSGLLRKELEVEEGWRTMYIKCNKGYITYQVDGKVLTSFDLGVTDAYPAYAALGVADFNNNYTVDFDSFYLFNGNVGAVKKILTEEEQEDKESSKEDKLRERRQRWIDNHREYLIEQDGKDVWVRASQLTQEEIENEAKDTRIDGEIPDRYDY